MNRPRPLLFVLLALLFLAPVFSSCDAIQVVERPTLGTASGMPEDSATEVASGSKLVDEAASKLVAIVDAIRTNTTAMEAIARASQEQATAIEQVSAAVRQMDEMTQHNAALVEQTNAAISQTESRAGDLDRMVEVFRLDTEEPTPNLRVVGRPELLVPDTRAPRARRS